LTNAKLRETCAKRNIPGYKGKRKAALIKLCCEFGKKKDLFDKDVESIKPRNVKKVRPKKNYRKKREKWQFELIYDVERSTFAGPDPMYTGLAKLPCPETMKVLAKWMKEGYLTRDREGRGHGIRVDKVTLRDAWGGEEIQGTAEIKDRGDHEMMLVNDSEIDIDDMKNRLKRFGGRVKRQCFDVQPSKTGDVHGIFLKK
jgi:hypothetical protein